MKSVATSSASGSIPVPVEERVAVFDNDGTLLCKKPAPIQLYFVLGRLAEMAEAGRSCGSASPGRPRTRTTAAGSRRWSPRTKSDWTKVF